MQAMPIAAVARDAGRERVLVLPREAAIPGPAWHGLRLGGVTELLARVRSQGEFRPRAEVESLPEWQQIIPHMVVRGDSGVLAMRRLKGGSERRLRGQISLGVGGHINSGDGDRSQCWERGCLREWSEEVICDTALTGRPLGLLKDDSGAVGQVHLGVLIVVRADGGRVSLREVEKSSGAMTSLADLGVSYLEMETWSQYVYDALLEGALEGDCPPSLELRLPASPGRGPEHC